MRKEQAEMLGMRTREAEGWPRIMVASKAAAYCGETSVASFRRGVGDLWPKPITIKGRGEVWIKDHLDHAIEKIIGTTAAVTDLADVL